MPNREEEKSITYRNISSFNNGFMPMHIVHFNDDGKFSYVQYSHDHFSVSSSFSLFAFNDSLMFCVVQRIVRFICLFLGFSVSLSRSRCVWVRNCWTQPTYMLLSFRLCNPFLVCCSLFVYFSDIIDNQCSARLAANPNHFGYFQLCARAFNRVCFSFVRSAALVCICIAFKTKLLLTKQNRNIGRKETWIHLLLKNGSVARKSRLTVNLCRHSQ